MKNYIDIAKELLTEKIIAILRVDSREKAYKGVEALCSGGIRNIEVTMNTPGVLEVIERFANDSRVMIGAGTVLDETACFSAIQHGANYIVTPTLNHGVIRCANRYQRPVVCGCATPSEMMEALELGVNMIKLFPASAVPYDFIKAVKAPLPQLLIGPTGGVSLKNLKEWEKAGADFYGIAGELSSLAKQERYEELESAARQYVQAVHREG